jgi:CspA family cold shock protein
VWNSATVFSGLAICFVKNHFRCPSFKFEEAAMPEGKIKKVLSDKGFGFIEGERDDLFFHHSEVQGTTIEQLSEGQLVEYQIGQGKKGPCAVSVQLAQ